MIDKKWPENMEYFSYFGSMIEKDVRSTPEIKFRLFTAKAAPQKQ